MLFIGNATASCRGIGLGSVDHANLQVISHRKLLADPLKVMIVANTTYTKPQLAAPGRLIGYASAKNYLRHYEPGIYRRCGDTESLTVENEF